MSQRRLTVTTIFLDDGGVMSDNGRRAREWQRLAREYLSPRLCGDPTAWPEANQVVFAGWCRVAGLAVDISPQQL